MTGDPTPAPTGPAATAALDPDGGAEGRPRTGQKQPGVPTGLPGPRGPELEACQFPGGCANAIEYAGTGRRPKYCYQVVAGVMHDRGNAKRVLDGATPARRRGDSDDDPGGARPISRAQQTVQAQVAGLASRLDEAATELRDALGNLADPDAVAAEIAAARRTARAEIDQAQAATEDAQARARAAEADAAAARRSAAASDQEAETAAEARRAAETGREQAEAERDELAGQLAGTRAELEATQQALDEAREERDRLLRDLDTAQAGHAAATHDRDEARVERDRICGELTELSRILEQVQAERDTRAEERDTAREQAAEARTRLAVADSTVTTLREQLDRDLERERAHGQQRLDDAGARHTARESELRAEVDQLRAELNHVRARAAATETTATEATAPDTTATDQGEAGPSAAVAAKPPRARRGGRRATSTSPAPVQRQPRADTEAEPDHDQGTAAEGPR